MQVDTTFATDLSIFGHIVPKYADQPKCSFGCPGGSNAPNLVPNATKTPQIGSLSLVDEQTSAPVVFLPVKFGDLAVSSLVDSGVMHNFLAASFLTKLQDSLSFVSIVPCQLQVTLVDGGVVQAAQLATLALEVVDDQKSNSARYASTGILYSEHAPCLSCTWYAFPLVPQPLD